MVCMRRAEHRDVDAAADPFAAEGVADSEAAQRQIGLAAVEQALVFLARRFHNPHIDMRGFLRRHSEQFSDICKLTDIGSNNGEAPPRRERVETYTLRQRTADRREAMFDRLIQRTGDRCWLHAGTSTDK